MAVVDDAFEVGEEVGLSSDYLDMVQKFKEREREAWGSDEQRGLLLRVSDCLSSDPLALNRRQIIWFYKVWRSLNIGASYKLLLVKKVCIKQKYTANSQDESAEEHKRRWWSLSCTIREKFLSSMTTFLSISSRASRAASLSRCRCSLMYSLAFIISAALNFLISSSVFSRPLEPL
ncbi:uncharacterized protein LOC110768073 [Prunus avium]|uniref:Uncharacterized protein LOC110768073 n=1 Tax=Prunus avium TaxID=42229 RepID=A0A6P5TJU8_PRUAV|nr:uncharacterized protein LOC110768073 [Prunus avium]